MVSFDGVNKLIICDVGTVSLSVKAMYSMWKGWMLISDNSKYPQAFRVVGGEPTVGNNIITPYFFMLNGWKIRPQEANHTLVVEGILLTEDSSDAFTDTIGAWRIGINQIVPIYTETVLVNIGGGTVEDVPTKEEIADAVWNSSIRTLTSASQGGGATAQEVWEYNSRELTVSSGLTAEQEAKLAEILTNVATEGKKTRNTVLAN